MIDKLKSLLKNLRRLRVTATNEELDVLWSRVAQLELENSVIKTKLIRLLGDDETLFDDEARTAMINIWVKKRNWRV